MTACCQRSKSAGRKQLARSVVGIAGGCADEPSVTRWARRRRSPPPTDALEILKETEDGRSILVRYLEDPENPGIVGTEDLCHEDELEEPVSGPTGKNPE